MTTFVFIDFGAVFWQSYHAAAENVGDTKRITVERIGKYAEGHDHVAICCDDPKRSIRRELFPDYKSNREAKPREAITGLEETLERLRADGYLLWVSDGLEGDDCLATAVRCATEYDPEAQITIVSGDKDLLQLVTDQVRVQSTATNNLLGPEEVMNKLGVYPAQVPELLALWGDTADGIPGVDRCGQKTGANLLREYGSIVGIYNALVAKGGKREFLTPVLSENLIAQRAQVVTALELVTLRVDAEIDFMAIFKPRAVKVLTRGEEEGLKRAAAEIEREIAVQEIDVWTPALEDEEPRPSGQPAQAMVVREQQQELARRGVDKILDTMRDMKLLRTYVQNQLFRGHKDGEGDYGRVPGTNKDTLFLSGAQKIAAYYNVRPVYDVIHRERLERGHIEYEIMCRLVSRTTGEEVSSGIGSCSSMERKYRYRGADAEVTDKPIPKAYWDMKKEDPKRALALIGGPDFTAKKTDAGWFIARKTGEQTENPDIADVHNTVLKMAKKRAFVDSVIPLGCLSELFTQDIGDTYDLTEETAV